MEEIFNNSSLLGEMESKLIGYFSKKSEECTYIIGVIDCSGSMGECWPFLCKEWNKIVAESSPQKLTTILFNSGSQYIEANYLKQSDCGGGTNIPSGFEKAFQTINEKKHSEKQFTILFISDGADSYMDSVQTRINLLPSVSSLGEDLSINLICIGIGSGFPTFISMNLRMKYHTGASSIPAVFLVEHFVDDTAAVFREVHSKFCSSIELVHLNSEILKYPWDFQKVMEIHEEIWFLCDANTKNDIEKAGSFNCRSLNELEKEEIQNIFSYWTQTLQLYSLNKQSDSFKLLAQKAHSYMSYIFEAYTSKLQKELESHNPNKKLTVYDRLKLRTAGSNTHILQRFIAEVKDLALGANLLSLSEDEVAKRLSIGTQQGKYHSKALQMKGLDQGQYENFKKSFIDILTKTPIKSDITSQEPSFVLYQNQKEVIMEDNIQSVISMATPFDLVEIFPMIGQTLMVKRNNASMINPFAISVINLPKINNTCDTVSLVSKGNEMVISIGNNEEEKFNCILPLFEGTEADQELKPYLRSKIFHLLMTFNCMHNVDTFFQDAYYGLLANTLFKVLTYPESDWKSSLIKKIYETTEMVYKDTKFFEDSLNYTLMNPREAVVTESKNIPHKCEDITKTILNILVLRMRCMANESKIKEIMQFAVIEGLGRLIKTSDELFRLSTKDPGFDLAYLWSKKEVVECTITEQAAKETSLTIQDEIKSIEHFYYNSSGSKNYNSIKEMKRNISFEFEKYLKFKEENTHSLFVTLNLNQYNHEQMRININNIRTAYLYFVKEELSSEFLWASTYHGWKYQSSRARAENIFITDMKIISTNLLHELQSKDIKAKNDELLSLFTSKVVKEYTCHFEQAKTILQGFKLNNDIIKKPALELNPNTKLIKVLFFGPQSSGKSALIGRILTNKGLVDADELEYVSKAYKSVYPKSHISVPYEWIVDSSLIEKVESKSINLSLGLIRNENKSIQIIDTPGKSNLFKRYSSLLSVVDHAFLVISSNIDEFDIKAEYIVNLIILYIFYTRQKTINIIITKIEALLSKSNELDLFIDYVRAKLTELLKSKKINASFNFYPVSAYSDYYVSTIKDISTLSTHSNKSLIDVIESLEVNEEIRETETEPAAKKAKFIVLQHNDKIKGLALGIIVEGALKVAQRCRLSRTNEELVIKSIQINFHESEYALSGMIVSIKFQGLKGNFKASDVIECDVLRTQPHRKIKTIKATITNTSKVTLKINQCPVIDYRFFRCQLQIVSVDNTDKEIKCNQTANIEMVPVYNSPNFFKIFSEYKNSSAFLIRDKEYKLLSIGSINDIVLK